MNNNRSKSNRKQVDSEIIKLRNSRQVTEQEQEQVKKQQKASRQKYQGTADRQTDRERSRQMFPRDRLTCSITLIILRTSISWVLLIGEKCLQYFPDAEK